MIVKRSTPSPDPSVPRAGLIGSTASVLRGAVRQAQRPALDSAATPASAWDMLTSNIPAMAAALAYRTIFGLVPVLVIGLMVIGSYAKEAEISSAVARLLNFAGLDQVVVDGSQPEAGADEGLTPIRSGDDRDSRDGADVDDRSKGRADDGVTSKAAGDADGRAGESGENAAAREPQTGPSRPSPPASPPASSLATSPASSQRLDQWIANLVTQVRNIPFRTIGFVGLAALIYAALSMVVEIERAFNQIYRVPAGRAWWSRITRYWTLLTLGSIGLFATFYATDAFMNRLDRIQSWDIRELLSGDDEGKPSESTSASPSIPGEPAVSSAVSPVAPAPSGGTSVTSANSDATPSGTATKGPTEPDAVSSGDRRGTPKDARTAVPPVSETAAGASAGDSKSTFSIRFVLSYATTVMITTLFLTIIYSVVPNARVKLTSAISGAFVAALLWEAAKWGFAYYVKSAGYSQLYGALALLPLFLLWIYVAWIIILLGLYISYSLQTYGATPLRMLAGPSNAIVDPASILLVVGAISRRFRDGKSMDAAEVAKASGLDQTVATVMLQRLVERGVIHRIATGADEDRFALARPPEAVAVEECLSIGRELASAGDPAAPIADLAADPALAALIRPLDQARLEAARGRTLADLLGLGSSGSATPGSSASASSPSISASSIPGASVSIAATSPAFSSPVFAAGAPEKPGTDPKGPVVA